MEVLREECSSITYVRLFGKRSTILAMYVSVANPDLLPEYCEKLVRRLYCPTVGIWMQHKRRCFLSGALCDQREEPAAWFGLAETLTFSHTQKLREKASPTCILPRCNSPLLQEVAKNLRNLSKIQGYKHLPPGMLGALQKVDKRMATYTTPPVFLSC
jgi:hypothetical protein